MSTTPLAVAYVVDHWQLLSETFIREEVASLRARGVRVVVVALGPGDVDPPPSPDELRLDLIAAGSGSTTSSLRAMARHPRRAARFAMELRRMHPERPPFRRALPHVAEVLEGSGVTWVHAHFAWDASGVAQALASLLGCGWSLTAHANDIFVRNRHLPRKLRQVPHLVTVCRYNVDELARAHGTLPDHHVVVCGVRVPEPVARVEADVDVLAVGRLVPKKGFDLLVRAAGIMAPARPGLTVEVVGVGPEHERLTQLAAELGVAAQVRFVGALPHDAVLERLQRARVVSLPARIAADGDRDSMPVVLKEAMAAGIPVVGTDVVAIPEMVDDEVGRLVPPEDPEALATALLGLLDDPVGAARAGAAGRRRVRERFELDREVAKLHQLFLCWSAPVPRGPGEGRGYHAPGRDHRGARRRIRS